MSYWRMIPLLVAALLMPGASAGQEDGPAEVVERFQATLLAVMREADELGYEGRYQHLDPAVRESHDLRGIARAALGRHWDQLDEEERASFVDIFSELSIATYAARFDAYGGETFTTVSVQRPAEDSAVVRTVFTDADGDTRSFNYMLQRRDERWRIINIIVDGVSDLALKRAEYSSIIRRQGFDALIAMLEERLARHAESEA